MKLKKKIHAQSIHAYARVQTTAQQKYTKSCGQNSHSLSALPRDPYKNRSRECVTRESGVKEVYLPPGVSGPGERKETRKDARSLVRVVSA